MPAAITQLYSLGTTKRSQFSEGSSKTTNWTQSKSTTSPKTSGAAVAECVRSVACTHPSLPPNDPKLYFEFYLNEQIHYHFTFT